MGESVVRAVAEARGLAGRASPAAPPWPLEYAVVYAETTAGLVLALRPPFAAVGERGVQLPVTLVSLGESPFTAARRALLEQTGHESDCWQPLGELPAPAAPSGSRAHLFRVWRAHPTAEIWTDGLTVPEVVPLSLLELTADVNPRSRAWFDLATVLTFANPQSWRTHAPQ